MEQEEVKEKSLPQVFLGKRDLVEDEEMLFGEARTLQKTTKSFAEEPRPKTQSQERISTST